MLQCRRIVNRKFAIIAVACKICVTVFFNDEQFFCHLAVLDTVDFVHADGRCMFRTCQAEKEKVVFQMVRTILTKALLHNANNFLFDIV